jgi:integrase/recombinase XerD
VPSAVDRVLAEFEVYLLDTRGLATGTCENNTRYARRFLEARYSAGDVDLRQLGAKELIGFILEQSSACAPETAALMRGALRSFLRFAHLQGLCNGTLAAAVPKVAHWRRANLPRSLSNEQLARSQEEVEVLCRKLAERITALIESQGHDEDPLEDSLDVALGQALEART